MTVTLMQLEAARAIRPGVIAALNDLFMLSAAFPFLFSKILLHHEKSACTHLTRSGAEFH